MKIINIAIDYSTTPGARYVTDGPFSGEDFRKTVLEPAFRDTGEPIQIVLDGTEGYATSFLEEAFGGLAREFGVDICQGRLHFVSKEDGLLIGEIMGYISDAKNS